MLRYALLAAVAAAQPLRIAVGGGNVGTNADSSPATLTLLSILRRINATGCRTNLYPGSYISGGGSDWDSPTPHSMDAFMLAAHNASITPILLFEYYASYYPSSGFGSWAQWRGIGAAFAAYLQPNGGWGQKYGIPDFGITVYTAINEPDGEANFTQPTGIPGPVAYGAAMGGLAAGIKSVNASLVVLPGGFMSANAYDDWTLGGLGKVLAPLWNNGSLDALDLHTYYDVQYAPMQGTYMHSAQANFDSIKAACGITNDALVFHTTEFNHNTRLVNETYAAAGLLTGIWDQFTVVNTAGSPVASLAFPWNIFDTNSSDRAYGMAVSDTPYVPTQRGLAWGTVLSILAGAPWAWVSADPRATGVTVLSAPQMTLTVWQNRDAWTNLATRDAFNVTSLPPGATRVRYYGFDGVRVTVSVPAGASWVWVPSIAPQETAMFLAD